MSEETEKNLSILPKLCGGITIVSILALLLTGFSYSNVFTISAIWTTLYWIIYQDNQQRGYAIACALSILIMAVAAYGLFTN